MNSSEMSMSKTKAKEMFKSRDRDMATKGGTNPSPVLWSERAERSKGQHR